MPSRVVPDQPMHTPGIMEATDASQTTRPGGVVQGSKQDSTVRQQSA